MADTLLLGRDAHCVLLPCPSSPVSSSLPLRIVEWFVLEGTVQGHLVQPPCSEQGHLQLDQVVQSPVRPDLECFQGWGT